MTTATPDRPAVPPRRPPVPIATPWTLECLAPLRELLPTWPAVLPSAVGDPVRPLAVGAQDHLARLLPADHPDAVTVLRRVLKRYARATQYQAALAEPGARRHALDGTALEPVAEDHARFARIRLTGAVSKPATPKPPEPEPASPQDTLTVRTTAKALKTTLVLNPASFTGLKVPAGVQHVALEVEVAGRTVTATIAAKAVRKVMSVLTDHGPEQVAIVLQGALAPDDTLTGAGVAAMVKAKS